MSIEIILAKPETAPADVDAVGLGADAALVIDSAGSSVLLDMNGEFYGISPVGAAMLKSALAHGRQAAVEALARRYRIEPARVGADLDRLLRDLTARGVVRGGRAPVKRRHAVGARVAAGLLGGMLRLSGKPGVRAAAALLASRLSFALFGWRATLDAWRSQFPQAGAAAVAPQAARAIDLAVRRVAARDWTGVDCKERALSCFALARAENLPASVHVGIALYPLGGHCWCRIGDLVVSDEVERCDRFLPVFNYA
jgi:hypothetical protein